MFKDEQLAYVNLGVLKIALSVRAKGKIGPTDAKRHSSVCCWSAWHHYNT